MTITIIDRRKTQILEAVVREYERTAEPVGSKIISSKYNIDASPATIRTEMAEMEEMGFLEQPHTSAGRTPTDKGWRYFIDILMEEEKLDERESKMMDEEIKRIKEDLDNIIRRTSKVLASFSHNLTIGTLLESKDFYSYGVSELLREPEFSRPDLTLSVADLVDNFEEKIDKVSHEISHETVVRVGRENPFAIDGISTVLSSFSLSDGREGFFCLIGPKRMNYSKNILLIGRVKNLLNNWPQ